MRRLAPRCGPPVFERCNIGRRRSRGFALFAVTVLAGSLMAAGCRADILVDIDIAHDGAGRVTVEVTFDSDVMRWAPDLEELIVLDDLTGWDVRHRRSGTPEGEQLQVIASKRFAHPEELLAVLAEIDRPPDGSAGLFRSATFVGSRDGAQVRYELSVTVGLDRLVSELVNPATADALEGELFGMPIEEIEVRAGAPLDELVTLVVRASVPQGSSRLPRDGVLALNAGGMETLTVTGELFDAEVAAADAEAERLAERAGRGIWIAVGWWIFLVVIVVAVLVLAVRARRRRGLRFR